MKIPYSSNVVKILLMLFDCLSVILIIVLFLDSDYDLFFRMFFIVISSLFSIVLFAITLVLFGNYEINNNGISFESLIYKRFCKWSDFNFIAKYNTAYRLTFETGFICSHKLKKDKFKRIHTTCNFSTKYFNICYSEELENYILMYASNIYEGMLIDDSISE